MKKINKLEIHCKNSDLTINSLACDINGKIYDFTGGQQDLKDGIVRFVGRAEDRIKEDPLRLLRMVRFASKYNFDIVYNYDDYIGETIELLDTIPGERIREELEKILVYPSAIENLKEFNILYQIFPEFNDVEHMTGGDKHNELVIEHLEESFKTACSITDDFKLRFAALFHDIGKGVTKEELEDKTTFYGHEEEGEKIFLKYAEKYKFSNDETKFIAFLIKNHMFGYNMGEIKTKTLIKFFNKMETARVTIMDFVTMLYCDNQGNLKKPRIKFKDFIEGNFFYRKYNELLVFNVPFKISDLEISLKKIK